SEVVLQRVEDRGQDFIKEQNMKMRGAILSVTIAALAAWSCAAPLADAQGETTPAPLKLLQTIPIPGLKDGDFDHFAADLAGHRLFLTAEKNSAVEVFDL